MTWRVAKSLLQLREQVNEQFPQRNKSADGTIGDAAHAARGNKSDHNPWVRIREAGREIGIVTALDITHDTRNGPNTHALAEFLRTQRDSRVKMVISDHRIFTTARSPWIWRVYTGGNPHSHHVHISVRAEPQHFDDTREWALVWGAPGGATEEPPARLVLRLGSRGEAVRDLQYALELQIDGIFGPATDAAVRAFQLKHQITVDGIVGPLTWQRLDVIAEQD